jgi:drug/metabolite transporter (DMT)-like permease
MAIIWALAAAFGYGISDYIARGASQREGSIKTMLYLQLVGSLVAGVLVFLTEPIPWQQVFSLTGLAAVLISLEFIAAGTLLYHALAVGPLMIVAPIVSSFAAVTVVLSLLSGERPGTLQIIGIVVTIAGVVLAATASGEPERERQPSVDEHPSTGGPSGVVMAVGAAVLIGIGSWLVRFIIPSLGSGTTVLVVRVSELVALSLFFLASKRSFQLRSLSSLKWLLPIGLLDTLANWFYNLGLLAGLTSIVSVIASLFSVVTVVLGYVISKERITRVQQVGILITLGGVALVSA